MGYQCPYPPQIGLTKSSHIRTLTNLGYHIYTPLCCTIKILQKTFSGRRWIKDSISIDSIITGIDNSNTNATITITIVIISLCGMYFYL